MSRFLWIFSCFLLVFNANAKELMPKVRVTKPSYTDFYDEYSFIGECKKSESRDFYATASGKITEISVNEGDNVNTGSIILKIDGPLYESKYQASKHSFERNKMLFSKSVISKDVFEASRAAFEASKKSYEDMIIKAPFDGRIGAIKYDVGDVVSIGDYLVSIVSDGGSDILVYLPEKLMPIVTKDSKVKILYQDQYQDIGKIDAISSYLNKDTGSFLVKISVPEQYNIIHGSYTKVKFLLNMHKGISLPEKAIMKDNNGSFVFLIGQDNIAQKKYVTLGSRVNDNIEITSEITENDYIVTDGVNNLYDKSKIEVIE